MMTTMMDDDNDDDDDNDPKLDSQAYWFAGPRIWILLPVSVLSVSFLVSFGYVEISQFWECLCSVACLPISCAP